MLLKPVTAAKFIDETIYTVKAVFVDSIKGKNGEFEITELRDLKVERCNQLKFGKNYQHLFTKGEFNDSYCINTLDFVLKGGFIYNKLSLIKIDIYPCKNSSDNNYQCQPQEEIDKYLAGGYFSILLKDIGLNPSNYSYPVLPTLQDIYTTISKQIYRDLILYYEITEVSTDLGIFSEKINKERFLKFDKKIETFYLRSEENYYNAESIIGIQIRLSDNIHVQNREYKKMQNVFATAGGYMQMLNAFFSLLSIFPNKFIYDNLIINNLFNYDPKKNKIIIKNRKYKHIKIKTYMSDIKNFMKENENNKKFNINIKNKAENINNDFRSEIMSRNNSKNCIKSVDKSINASALEKMSNISKNEIFPFSTNPNIQLNAKLMKTGKDAIEMDRGEENFCFYESFNLNPLDYFCLGKCNRQNKKYNQFKKGTLIFKQKLDIINIFNFIIFYEKKNDEKINKISSYQ